MTLYDEYRKVFPIAAEPSEFRGIIEAEVSMAHPGVSYHSGEREYRVPPEAVLKISGLMQ